MSIVWRGFCSVCRGWYATRNDGTIRAHKRFNAAAGKYSAAPMWIRCEGTGKTPVPG